MKNNEENNDSGLTALGIILTIFAGLPLIWISNYFAKICEKNPCIPIFALLGAGGGFAFAALMIPASNGIPEWSIGAMNILCGYAGMAIGVGIVSKLPSALTWISEAVYNCTTQSCTSTQSGCSIAYGYCSKQSSKMNNAITTKSHGLNDCIGNLKKTVFFSGKKSNVRTNINSDLEASDNNLAPEGSRNTFSLQ